VLWALSDSLIDNKPLGIGRSMTISSPLMTIGDTTISVGAWTSYAHVYRFKQDGSGVKPYDQLMDEFTENTLYNYYRDHLEDYNEEFRNQMEEFRDGNLFFEIMQQEIWNHGQTDTAALSSLYEKNKKNYLWNASADAVLFFCSDQATATTLYENIKKDPGNWRKLTEAFTEKVAADSARFEWDQIPNLEKAIPKPGMVLEPLVNTMDNTAAFAYIINVYPQPMQRSFAEARGLVINDYQISLENEWINKLRKKYPVVIKEDVFDSITK
jgi:peptidyl-prolyl cis-trans isomerase SurA